MVSLEQVQSSNARIASSLPDGLVAVFLGGTGAVGQATLKQFTKLTVRPRIYFLGRSQASGDRITAELKALNPEGDYCFIRADVSLLATVDDVCGEIKRREHHINLLFMTTATLLTGKDTAEGLYYQPAVTYYSRIRFTVNLLPLLQRAPALRRVVTVFTATKEGPVWADDFPGRYVPLLHQRAHYSSMMTLALESLGLEAPDVSFIHSFPGSVKTSHVVVLRLMFKIMGPLVQMSPAEAGERQVFLATSGRFPPRLGADVRGETTTAGVPVDKAVGLALGTGGEEGTGVYSVSCDGEPASAKVREALARLRGEDVLKKLWLHTEDVFTAVTGTTFV
ncbi:hypothetical protein B0T18DRAFT_438714 [Schizothecium vesticola]|uniref:Uncharacterized protein n=1 Tax=Schizothecium vesticola TaxID=314040 RepID=A0AA40K662_9PEZI|nr:hypothetical protein B0T18DRAFT_438714 [Schizothecium vesticola]